MPEQAINGHAPHTKPVTESHRAASIRTRSGIGSILGEAVRLKALAVKVAGELEQGDESDPDGQKARARSQAVTSVCKAFADMVTIIRIERGKPLPGSLRPESKPKKQKQASWAMVELVPKPKQLPPAPSTPPEV